MMKDIFTYVCRHVGYNIKMNVKLQRNLPIKKAVFVHLFATEEYIEKIVFEKS